jgi:Raf kinase inhibitor-like YbhB/YbcL family protein
LLLGQQPGSTIGRNVMWRLLTATMLVTLLTTLPTGANAQGASSVTLSLTSSAFAEDGEIPMRYTCEGQDVSPPLAWSQPPSGTRSLALIVDDPDAPDPKAPKMTWVHWVLYNLPPTAGQVAEAVERRALPTGTREGLNDWKRPGYGGPCPPIGRHRYFHKLYALDAVLPDLGQPSKAQLEKAMQGHVLAQAELVGTYEKKGQ